MDLEAIRARCEAATEGPWEWRVGLASKGSELWCKVGATPRGQFIAALDAKDIGVSDGEFIAHARADIPALIAEVERLRSALGYISSPTMGLPSGHDALDFAGKGGATEDAARYALQICIRTARAALSDPTVSVSRFPSSTQQGGAVT